MSESGQGSVDLDVLSQAIREIEGLLKLEDVVPPELLWDRPPGLPSGAELLWLLHLTDTHVFSPALDALAAGRKLAIEPPSYGRLLDAHPIPSKSMDDLVRRIRGSRRRLTSALAAALDAASDDAPLVELIDMVTTHDRRILSTFTERLYESGLGAK